MLTVSIVHDGVELGCRLVVPRAKKDACTHEAGSYEDADDVIYVEQGRKELDLWPFVYDFIALAIPLTHSHPEGQCNPEMESRLSQYMVQQEEPEE